MIEDGISAILAGFVTGLILWPVLVALEGCAHEDPAPAEVVVYRGVM